MRESGKADVQYTEHFSFLYMLRTPNLSRQSAKSFSMSHEREVPYL
jgi:hypothetical protein